MLTAKEYEKTVRKDVKDLLMTCRENGIPIFVSVVVEGENHKLVDVNDIVSAQEVGVAEQLGAENKQTEFIKIINGFKATPMNDNSGGLGWVDNTIQTVDGSEDE